MIEKLVPVLRQKQADIAKTAMVYHETKNPTLLAGQWQGVQMALEAIEELLVEPEDK